MCKDRGASLPEVHVDTGAMDINNLAATSELQTRPRRTNELWGIECQIVSADYERTTRSYREFDIACAISVPFIVLLFMCSYV